MICFPLLNPNGGISHLAFHSRLCQVKNTTLWELCGKRAKELAHSYQMLEILIRGRDS